MEQKLISICIPTYNRPEELKRTLESIDTTKYDDVNIVISENCSPKQQETRAIVEEYKKHSKYEVHYYENEKNIGYDKNIRALVQRSKGKFSMFFSDDDMFMPGAMDEFVEFVRKHQDCGYILRSYRNYKEDGSYNDFRYYSQDQTFPAGKETAMQMFDKSVFLSGFTIRTEYAQEYVTDALDGSLLYQIYLVLEVCRRYPSVYSTILISKSVPISNNKHYFGECEEEKKLYKTGLTGVEDRLNFAIWYMKIIDYIEAKYKDGFACEFKKYMSKYSYSIVSCGRGNYWDWKTFFEYGKQLKKVGYGSSIYYYIYFYALLILGKDLCWKTIYFLKKVIGHRPKL